MDHEIPSVTEITMAEIERRCAVEEKAAAFDRQRIEALSYYLSEFLKNTDQIGTVFIVRDWAGDLGTEAFQCMLTTGHGLGWLTDGRPMAGVSRGVEAEG